MLPHSSTTSSSIHINPKFRNVHINPNFLGKTATTTPSNNTVNTISRPQIYVNPRFLNKPVQSSTTSIAIRPVNSLVYQPLEPLADTTIHTRKKIINASIAVAPIRKLNAVQPTLKPLIKIGSKKLIRINSNQSLTKSLAKVTKPKLRRPIQTKYKIVKEQTAFKIDRRTVQSKQIASRLKKVLALNLNKKQWINENLMPTKATVISNVPAPSSKSSAYLNINGILYKANRRKLEKTVPTNKYSINKTHPNYRRLTVRGESFLLDASGKNLIRVQNEKPIITPAATIKRIDIGKITFMKNANGTYERTDFHKSRYHLNVAKQRSIQMLTNRLVKSNIPCPIYRKLGKCATFERGKCTKLHDKKLIDICPRFLRGTCHKESCLLSHDTTLSKMPTCRFYLQGMCSRTDCPYLHKKVNEKTDICVDFLRGYCDMAEECPKRHEFLCPEQESKGTCKLTRCPHPHRTVTKRRPKLESVKNVKPDPDKELEKLKRYFADDAAEVQCENSVKENSATNANEVNDDVDKINIRKRPKLGKLPSFIPIG